VDAFVPCLTVHRDGPELAAITLGHPLLDDYLAFVAARARTGVLAYLVAWVIIPGDGQKSSIAENIAGKKHDAWSG
jgi:hypothetical protein